MTHLGVPPLQYSELGGAVSPAVERAVYGNSSNEALADLTNSSLIQNSAHRQFHIISRSRPDTCSAQLVVVTQVAVICRDFIGFL